MTGVPRAGRRRRARRPREAAAALAAPARAPAVPCSRPVDRLTLTRPDDWHLHLRDGEAMRDALAHSAGSFARAIVMPNLRPPVVRTAQALAYRERILAARPAGAALEPLMTLYLTEETPPEEIARARASGVVHGVKLYPAGATTHSDAGVRDIDRVASVLEAMEREDLPLLVHAEVVDAEVDVYDRERVFVERHLEALVRRFEGLRVVLEHVTTEEGVAFVRESPPRVAATVTPHHLLVNRNDLFAGGLRPHHYCLPLPKRERHRAAVLAAATADDPRFFLGTDSAPHARADKESACGCAGVFSAPVALALYAEAFEAAGAIERLEAFASFRGADFYRLPRNAGTLTLERRACTVPERLAFGAGEVVPFRAGGEVRWSLVGP